MEPQLARLCGPLATSLIAASLLLACKSEPTSTAPVPTTAADAKGDVSTGDNANTTADGGTNSQIDSVSDTSNLGDTANLNDAAAAAIGLTELCPLLAKKTCEGLVACACPLVDGSLAACTIKQNDNCSKQILGYAGGISLGALTLDSTAAAVCLAGLDVLAKACDKPSTRNHPMACSALFVDSAALQGTCAAFSVTLLCAGAKGVCAPDGKCTPLPSAGQACGAGQRCAGGLVCDGTCHVPGAAGSPCSVDLGCQLALVCSTAGTCQAPAKTGESCLTSDQCAVDLACQGTTCTAGLAQGAACVGDKCGANTACVIMSTAPICREKSVLGGNCDGESACQAGLFCDFVGGSICKPEPKLGAPCPASVCGPGLACTAAGVCTSLAKLGEACLVGASLPCEVGVGCDAVTGKCVAPPSAGSPCLLVGTLCSAGTFCDQSVLPAKCVVLAEVGAPCNNDDGSCKPGLYCNDDNNVCATLVPLGGSCKNPNACGSGKVCVVSVSSPSTGICKSLPNQLGAPCEGECTGGWRCSPPDGSCAKGICVLQ